MKKILYSFVLAAAFFVFNTDVNAATISDGVYTIQSAIADKVVDLNAGNTKNGNNIQLYASNDTVSQKWKVTNLGNDYYEIASIIDNSYVLDVDGGGKKKGTNVQIYKQNNTSAQKWTLKYAGDGYYYIISKCNGLYLDVDGGKSANKTNIQVYTGNSTKAQKFKFIEVLEGTKTIDDGLYKITSNLNNQKSVSVKNRSSNNNTATVLNDVSDEWSNIWRFKYLNNGYYSITSYLDETKVLDVSGGSSANNTKIQIHNANNTISQKWIVKDLGDGNYSIVSGIDHKYMDVDSGHTTNGTKIQLYQGNSTASQQFKLEKVEEPTITEGYYTLNSMLDETKVVAVNSEIVISNLNVDLRTDDNANGKKWYIKPLGDGLYSIKTAANGNIVMDVYNGDKISGTNVWIHTANDSEAQKWYIKEAGDGYYYIIAKNSSLYLDVAGGKTYDGTNIQIYNGNNTVSQKFKLNPTTLNENDVVRQNYEEGYYTINSKLNVNKALDVNGGKKANGTKVQLYDNNNTVAQRWYLKKLNEGYYAIVSSMNPEIALTAASGNTENGISVQMSKYTGSATQQWAIKGAGNDYAAIVSKASGLNIDVSGGNTANGTKIQLYESNNGDSQLFKITKNDSEKVYTGIDVSHHQNLIDWATVGNSDVGFVIIRAGYGGNWTSQDDKQFLNNVAACEKYNIPYGLYLYSYASEIDNSETSAQAEAKHMLRLINEIEQNNYSPNLGTKVFIDMEDKSVVNAGKDKLTAVSDTFCSTIEANGYSCGIYANRTWLTQHLNTPELAKKYEIWLAEYLPVVSPSYSYAKTQKPIYNLTPIKYWQFASDGKMNGISGNVDLDLGYDIFD